MIKFIELTDLERAVALALLNTVAPYPCSDGADRPVLTSDPDLDDLPYDHTEGTEEDNMTQVAVARLARAAIKAVRGHDENG